MPVGEEDKIELTIGKGKKSNIPLALSMHRIILDKSKKQSKIVVQNTDFIVDETFDNHLMVEIFSGKIAVFHDVSTLLIDAARIGRSDLIISTIENNPDLNINAKNFKGQCALHMAASSIDNFSALQALMSKGKNLEWDITDQKGNTCLHFAAKNGNLRAIQLLMPKMVRFSWLSARYVECTLC